MSAVCTACVYFALFDVNYLVRIAIDLIVHTMKRHANVDETYRLSGRVWPRDVDHMSHMNNARYLNKLEHGRLGFLVHSGLHSALVRARVPYGLGGVAVRFRREIRPFQSFELKTRLAGWDKRSFYLEQTMEISSFVHAYSISKITLKRNAKKTPSEVLRTLPGAAGLCSDSRSKTIPETFLPNVVKEYAAFGVASSESLKRA